jgi:hypothetical protein
MFCKPYEVEVPTVECEHGGPILAQHLYSNEGIDAPFRRSASYQNGVKSLAISILANESIATWKSVCVRDLIAID